MTDQRTRGDFARVVRDLADDPNTRSVASRYEAFVPAEAPRIAD